MKFKDQFPNYRTYSNDTFLMNEVTFEMMKELAYELPKLFVEQAKKLPGLYEKGTFKNMTNDVAGYTNNGSTSNWGWDYLIRDFEESMLDFKGKQIKFHKFMDCMATLLKYVNDHIEDINDIFEDYDFGYRLTGDIEKPWRCINPNVEMSVDVGEVIQSTEDLCKQTAEHIRQARTQLTRANELRARKDAIRDCLSAMESLMGYLTGVTDIKQADRKIRDDEEKWGSKLITKDGLSLFNFFHKQYDDIRHGNAEISEISYDEAIYFIDRILAYVKYIAARAVETNNDE